MPTLYCKVENKFAKAFRKDSEEYRPCCRVRSIKQMIKDALLSFNNPKTGSSDTAGRRVPVERCREEFRTLLN